MFYKKILIGFFCAVITFAVASLSAYAAAPSFSVEPSGSFAPGETVTAEISLQNARGFISAEFIVEWDPDVMSYEDIDLTEDEARESAGGKIRDDAASFEVILASAFEEDTLPLVTLHMKIEGYSESGYELAVSVYEGDIDGVDEPAPVTVNLSGDAPSEPATDAPSAPTEPVSVADDAYLGDADGNGKVTAGDARSILRHAARIETIPDEYVPLCDINRDGKLKSGDARIVLRMAARLETLYFYKDGYHEHRFTSERTKEPTCTEPGEITKTCTVCGYSVTEPIPAGHTFVTQITKEPTCTEEGELTKTCTVCGEVEKEPLRALGHDFVSSQPNGPRYCSRCGVSEAALYASQIRLSLSTDTLNLRRNAAVPVPVKLEGPEGLVLSLVAEGDSDALGVAWLYDDYDQLTGYLLIVGLKNVSGAKVTVSVPEAPGISADIQVNVGSGGPENYSGLDAIKGVPDFGVYTGAAPVGGSASSGGDWIAYVYDEADMINAGKSLDKAQDAYIALLKSKGFSYHDNGGLWILGERSYYYKGNVRVYFERILNEGETGDDDRYYFIITLTGN